MCGERASESWKAGKEWKAWTIALLIAFTTGGEFSLACAENFAQFYSILISFCIEREKQRRRARVHAVSFKTQNEENVLHTKYALVNHKQIEFQRRRMLENDVSRSNINVEKKDIGVEMEKNKFLVP